MKVINDTTPSERKTAAADAYELIRERILEGAYQPHEYIRESAVAAELKISRTPVREALRELISEGWLEAIPHAGARVVEWTHRDACEVFEIRLVLEPLAVAAACQHIDGVQLQHLKQLALQMEKLVRDMPQAVDVRNEVSKLNHEFHRILIESSGNQRLSQLLSNIVPNSVIRRNMGQYKREHLQRSMQHHAEILQALEARNAAWAECMMRTHLLAARELHTQFSDGV